MEDLYKVEKLADGQHRVVFKNGEKLILGSMIDPSAEVVKNNLERIALSRINDEKEEKSA